MKKKLNFKEDCAELGVLIDNAGLLDGELICEKEIYSYILGKGSNPFTSIPSDLEQLQELGCIIKIRKGKKPEKVDREKMINSLFKLEEELDQLNWKMIQHICKAKEHGEQLSFEEKKIKKIIGGLLCTIQKACEQFEGEALQFN